MAWIPMIPEDEAEGELKEWYDRLRDPGAVWTTSCAFTASACPP